MLNNTDLLIVERAGVQYSMTADQIAVFVGAAGKVNVPTIADRDALTSAEIQIGYEVFVADASDDSSVTAGWAKYRVDGIAPITFIKLSEQEGLDTVIVSASNLTATSTPSVVEISNDNGDGAIIPAVSLTNAGVATPAMLANSHVPATKAGTSGTNPVNITGQEIGFGIAQLVSLP